MVYMPVDSYSNEVNNFLLSAVVIMFTFHYMHLPYTQLFHISIYVHFIFVQYLHTHLNFLGLKKTTRP